MSLLICNSSQELCTWCALLGFIVITSWLILLSIFLRVASLAMGQSCNCASEVTLTNMGEYMYIYIYICHSDSMSWPCNFSGAYASMAIPVVLQNRARSGEYGNKCTEYANDIHWIVLCDTFQYIFNCPWCWLSKSKYFPRTWVMCLAKQSKWLSRKPISQCVSSDNHPRKTIIVICL